MRAVLALATALAPLLALRAGPAFGEPADAGEPPLRLYYYERPPFHYTDDQGRVTGLFADTTEQILHRAGLRFEWVRMPANRILLSLRKEPEVACSPAWYATPQRQADFWFSKPILRDKPLIALLRADFPLEPGTTARDFFQSPKVRLLLKQNFSQGAYMNALIARMPPAQVQQVSLEVPAMVQMLKRNRADAIITTAEEAGIFVRQAGYPMSEFLVVQFPDVPAEEYRYILCKRSMSAQVRQRIDEAIPALP